MNIHIVKGLLTDCPLPYPTAFFPPPSLSFEECMELKRKYDTFGTWHLPIVIRQSFHFFLLTAVLSRKLQLAGIVSCANTYHLFCSPVTIDDMESLSSPCKIGFCLRVNSVRRVAILFDALLENSFIQPYWQSVPRKRAFPAIQGRLALHIRNEHIHHAFVGQEQNDFNRLQYQKVCKPTEGMKGSAKKSTM